MLHRGKIRTSPTEKRGICTGGELQDDRIGRDPAFLDGVHFKTAVFARVHEGERVDRVEGDLAERRHAVDDHCEDEVAIAEHGIVLPVLVVGEKQLLVGGEAFRGRFAENRAELSLK